MPTLLSISKRVLAALIFFTRLPFHKLAVVERSYYERVVPLWPLVGYLTGGVMTLVFVIASACGLSLGISLTLAVLSRVMVTGALHEDGFADFCDGFGGGYGRERILEIMKDSHIGTYGVLGLILYYVVLYNLLIGAMAWDLSPWILLSADAFSKYLGSTIIYFLPYARNEEGAKNKLVYQEVPQNEKIVSFLLGTLPLGLLLVSGCQERVSGIWLLALILVPALTCVLLFRFMNRCIQGYTGDCCGATFIIVETVFYLMLNLALAA